MTNKADLSNWYWPETDCYNLAVIVQSENNTTIADGQAGLDALSIASDNVR
jgi:hypothetical protein